MAGVLLPNGVGHEVQISATCEVKIDWAVMGDEMQVEAQVCPQIQWRPSPSQQGRVPPTLAEEARKEGLMHLGDRAAMGDETQVEVRVYAQVQWRRSQSQQVRVPPASAEEARKEGLMHLGSIRGC